MRRRHAAAFALAVVGHLSLLIGLPKPTPTAPPPQPTLLLTLSGERGGAPAAVSTPDRPATAAKAVPVATAAPATPAAAPVDAKPELPAETPSPASEPALSPEALAMAALSVQFDREPDPATTGDAAALEAMPGLAGARPGLECPIAGGLVAALESDLAVQAALARIPRPSRSVANAVMLWDGRWVDPRRVGGVVTIEAVRQALARGLADASAECREQMMLGPMFLPVVNGSETLVLALGSGAWRWQDLLLDPTAALPSGEPSPRM